MTPPLLVLLGVLLPVLALAETLGGPELDAVQGIITGNIGLAIGLGLTIWGIFRLASGNTGGAVVLILCGIVLTVFPGVFKAISATTQPIINSLTGGG